MTGLIFDDFLHLQFAPLQINNSDTLIQVMVKLARFSLIVHSKHSAIKTTAICFHSIELFFANLGPYSTPNFTYKPIQLQAIQEILLLAKNGISHIQSSITDKG